LRCQCGARFLQSSASLFHRRAARLQLGVGVVERLLRQETLRDQVNSAPMRRLCIGEIGLLARELRTLRLHVRRILPRSLTRHLELRVRLVHRHLKRLRIDVEQCIALVHELILFDVHGDHLTDNLRRDLDDVGVDVGVVGRTEVARMVPVDEATSANRECGDAHDRFGCKRAQAALGYSASALVLICASTAIAVSTSCVGRPAISSWRSPAAMLLISASCD